MDARCRAIKCSMKDLPWCPTVDQVARSFVTLFKCLSWSYSSYDCFAKFNILLFCVPRGVICMNFFSLALFLLKRNIKSQYASQRIKVNMCHKGSKSICVTKDQSQYPSQRIKVNMHHKGSRSISLTKDQSQYPSQRITVNMRHSLRAHTECFISHLGHISFKLDR
jgi:hypothetical protein